jgi:predicted porin
MKKTLIALAALASTAAFAQSNVSLYAYGDFGLGQSVGVDQKGQMNPNTGDVNGIRMGMQGKQDLGGGMAVSFQLEANTYSETGAGDGGYGRATWVGLGGGFGTVQLGRQVRNSVIAAVATSASGWRGTDPEAAVGIRYSINNNVAVSSRNSAMINYISPKVSGFSARIGAVMSEDNGGNSITDLALMYANGPIYAAYGYIKANGQESNSGFHASYDLGMAKLMGGFHKRGATATAAAADGFNIGVKAPMGATSVYAGYAKNNDTDVSAYELGLDYALSKTTVLNFAVADNSGNNVSMGYYAGLRFRF